MFGGRHPEEEGIVYEDTPQGRQPRRDGQLVLAPSFDGIPIRAGTRMLVPVDESGEPLDPSERIVFDPSTPLAHRGVVVYLPPHFKLRVSNFMLLFDAG
jgi:hypothetical protein